jgi:hypothetical protein
MNAFRRVHPSNTRESHAAEQLPWSGGHMSRHPLRGQPASAVVGPVLYYPGGSVKFTELSGETAADATVLQHVHFRPKKMLCGLRTNLV